VHFAHPHLCRFPVRFLSRVFFPGSTRFNLHHLNERFLSLLHVLSLRDLSTIRTSSSLPKSTVITRSSPSGYAFQLPIRNRLTQLEILFSGTFVHILLEPLRFRPNRFSRFFPLLMSTFSLLIAPAKSYRLPSPCYTERSTTLMEFVSSFHQSPLRLHT